MSATGDALRKCLAGLADIEAHMRFRTTPAERCWTAGHVQRKGVECDLYHAPLEAMTTTDGAPLLAPVLAAEAQCLAALVALGEGVDS